MFSLTPYEFQPLFLKFISLWEYVQIASDCVTFMLTFLCCQCCPPMSQSLPTSCADFVQKEDLKVLLPEAKINVGGFCGEPTRPQLIGLDFKVKLGDSEELQEKCCEFWDVVNTSSELQRICQNPREMINTVPIYEEKEITNDIKSEDGNDFPAIHVIRIMESKGQYVRALKCSAGRKETLRVLQVCKHYCVS